MTAPRLRRLTPGDLDDRQRALYESIVGGPRAQGPRLVPMADADGGLEGPFNAMLLSPAFGDALQTLGTVVRYQGRLSDRAREVAILVVARHWQSEFETYAHELIGRSVGLDDAELEAIRNGRFDAFSDEIERAAAQITEALAARGDLTDAEYHAGVDAIGTQTLFELTTLVGYYATLAMQMKVYRVS